MALKVGSNRSSPSSYHLMLMQLIKSLPFTLNETSYVSVKYLQGFHLLPVAVWSTTVSFTGQRPCDQPHDEEFV